MLYSTAALFSRTTLVTMKVNCSGIIGFMEILLLLNFVWKQFHISWNYPLASDVPKLVLKDIWQIFWNCVNSC